MITQLTELVRKMSYSVPNTHCGLALGSAIDGVLASPRGI